MASANFYSHDLAVVHLIAAGTWSVPADCIVLDAWFVKKGTTAGNASLTDGTNTIVAATALGTVADVVTHAPSIATAYRSLTNGKTLTFSMSAGDGECFVLLALSATD